MKLGDFLSPSGGASIAAPTKPVKFRVIGISPATGERRIADAEAVLVFVSEHERQEAIRDAHQAMRGIYGVDPVPPDRLNDEMAIQLLRRALRDKDDPRQFFCETARDLRNAMTIPALQQVNRAYFAFVEEEFPDAVTEAEMKALAAEAKKS